MEPSPWVWDEKAQKHRYFNDANQRWIWEDEAQSTSAKSTTKKIKTRWDSARDGQDYERDLKNAGYRFAYQFDDPEDEEQDPSQFEDTRTGKHNAVDRGSIKVGEKIFRRHPSRIFRPGTVFQCILNSEVSHDAHIDTLEGLNKFRLPFNSQICMFVVLQDNEDYSSTCLSVKTYNGQGVSKRGVKKSNHSIIYSSNEVPHPLEFEFPRGDERGMRTPVRVEVLNEWEQLDPRSRINLRARHTCQHSWHIYLIGNVAARSWVSLWEDHRAVIDIGRIPSQEDAPVAATPRSKKKRKSTRRAFDDYVDANTDVKPGYNSPTDLKSSSSMSRAKPRERQSDHAVPLHETDAVEYHGSFTSARMMPIFEALDSGPRAAEVIPQGRASESAANYVVTPDSMDQSKFRYVDNVQQAKSTDGDTHPIPRLLEDARLAPRPLETTSSDDSMPLETLRESGTGVLMESETQAKDSTSACGESSSKSHVIEPTISDAQSRQKSSMLREQSEPIEHVATEFLPGFGDEPANGQSEGGDFTLDQQQDAHEVASSESGFEAWMVDETLSETNVDIYDPMEHAPSTDSEPTATTDAFDAIIKDFAELIWSLPDAKNLLKAAVNAAHLTRRKLTEEIAQLLDNFAIEYATETDDSRCKAFADDVRRKSSTVSLNLVRRVYKETGASESPMADSRGQTANAQASREELVHVAEEDVATEDLPSVQEINHQILSSDALVSLRRSLREIVHPSFGTVLGNLFRAKVMTSHKFQAPTILDLVRELKTAHPFMIKYTKTESTVSDHVKSWVERSTGQEWDWWPLSPPRKPLQEGSVRVEWLSIFGALRTRNAPAEFTSIIDQAVDIYYDAYGPDKRTKLTSIMLMDRGESSLISMLLAGFFLSLKFALGIAHVMPDLPKWLFWLAVLIVWLLSVAITHLTTRSGTGNATTPGPPSLKPAEGTQPDQSPSSSSTDPPAISKGPSAPTTAANASQHLVHRRRQHQSCPQLTRVLVLVTPSLDDNHGLAQIKVSKDTTVDEFFKHFKRKYFRHRGFMAYFSVWKYHHCDFYHSIRFYPKKFAPRKKDELPPRDNGDYRICLEARIGDPPPVTIEEFNWGFYHNPNPSSLTRVWSWLRGIEPKKDAEQATGQMQQHLSDMLAYLPQKIKKFDKLGTKRESFWGIYAKEHICFRWVLFWNIVCISPGIVFFFLWLFKLGGVRDLQTAGVPITTILACLTLFWTLFAASIWGHQRAS